jgi:hypothetical protein
MVAYINTHANYHFYQDLEYFQIGEGAFFCLVHGSNHLSDFCHSRLILFVHELHLNGIINSLKFDFFIQMDMKFSHALLCRRNKSVCFYS